MTEKDFELLMVLDETQNITKAADRLFITQSALSKRIKIIEAELGVELLIRSKQGIRFTPAGEAALQRSRRAAEQMEALRQDLDALEDEISGTLRAGFSINYAMYRLPDLLAAYHCAYPKVRLRVTTGQSRHLFRQLIDGALDVAVLRGEYAWDGVRYMLSQENICLVYNREYEGVPLSDLLYVSHQTDPNMAGQMNQWMRENGLHAGQTSVCVDSVTTCMEMVRRGLGWAILPEIGLGDYDGCVVPCTFADGEPFVRRTYAMIQPEAVNLPQVKAFVDTIRGHHQ